MPKGPQRYCQEGRCGSVGLMGPFDSRSIANRILDIADRQGKSLTVMQLLKLVYLAHGWWLSFSGGKPLTDTSPQAWQYGPVHPEVYRAFRHHGRSPIRGRAIDAATGFEFRNTFPHEVDSLIEQVVRSYGDHHAFTLSNIMHQPGTPWHQVNSKYGDYAPIDNSVIQARFDELRRQRAG